MIRKKWKISTTDSKHKYPICDNILNRDFHADRAGTKWVSYITYLKTGEGWLYLTAVMYLADRKIIGWTLSEGMSAEQTSLSALEKVLKARKAEKETVGITVQWKAFPKLGYACSGILRDGIIKADSIQQLAIRRLMSWRRKWKSGLKSLRFTIAIPHRTVSVSLSYPTISRFSAGPRAFFRSHPLRLLSGAPAQLQSFCTVSIPLPSPSSA